MKLWPVLMVFLCCSNYMTGLARKYLAEVEGESVTQTEADEANDGDDYRRRNWGNNRKKWKIPNSKLKNVWRDIWITAPPSKLKNVWGDILNG